VTKEPDRDWERLLPHLRHQIESYSRWTEEAFGRPAGPYVEGLSAEQLKQSHAYRVLTPEATLELAESLGSDGVLYLSPLLAGIDPELSWQMLRLYEREVHPHLRP
jgi:hypothetical protein